MLVRTISQLPQATSDYSNGLLEISIPQNNNPSLGKYTSKAISQTTLSSGIASSVESTIASNYGLKNGSTNINVNGIRATVNTLSSGNTVISGIKGLNSWPYIKKPASAFPTSGADYGGDVKYIIPNVDKVNDLIGTQPVYFSSTDSMVAEGVPLNTHSSAATDASVPESLSYATTIGLNKFYFWHIDENDSSNAVYDTRSNTVDAYEQMRDTGQLVVWGWLADNGDVSPEMAWVGLFAALKCEGQDATQTFELPISIQPWIRGQNASSLQYVSFNIPVKKGLKLKIKTGFTVNQQTSGAFQNKGTMTFIDRYVPNSFFGYIVK